MRSERKKEVHIVIKSTNCKRLKIKEMAQISLIIFNQFNIFILAYKVG